MSIILLAEIRPVNPPKVELKRKPIIKYKGVIKEKQEVHIVANRFNITSNVEFHNRYNIIIIPLLEQDRIIIIIDIIEKKLSKHKKNFSKRFRYDIIPITLPNVKINIIQ